MHRKKLCFFNRLVSIAVLVNFLATTFLPAAYAQEIFLPPPGAMVHLSPAFNPPILKGIKVYPDNPFLFDFILDNGQSGSKGDSEEAGKLVKYFLASLTTPENDMWVNLSPYEKDRIVPESFGQTEMGRDLLAQDYMLKQITASLIYPEDELGKKFWDRVYAEAKKNFGTTDIPVNTFNKVWIVPEKAVVYENPQSASAYVVESKLKVMLEEDYVALANQKASAESFAPAKDVAAKFVIASQSPFVIASPKGEAISGQIASSPSAGLPSANQIAQAPRNDISTGIIREIIIPALTKEVNEGKNFSQLRQIYNSLILAAWYKKKIKDSILNQVYVDKNKVAGVEYVSSVIANEEGPHGTSPDSAVIASREATKQSRDDKELIYQQYLEAFKKGAYNYIKEETDPVTQDMIPKKYFSGGFSATRFNMGVLDVTSNSNILSGSSAINGNGQVVQVQISSSPIETERGDLLASAEDRFEKENPYSRLVQKPERELNEKVAEWKSAVEIQMGLDRLLTELGTIVSQQEIPGLFEVGLDEREAGFLRNLGSLSQSMPVPIHDELPFAEVSQVLKDLRASRNRIYAAIEKADRENNSDALKDLNRQAIRNNRLILKAQIVAAEKMMAGQSNLKGRDIILGAVGASLHGAMNTAQQLKRELGYRIGRLQAAQMVREIETTDWLGKIIRTYRMSGFDIEVSPTTADGQEPTVTIRQQYWVNAHTRLNQTLTDLRMGRVDAAQIQLDNLRNLYNVKHLIIYEKYREIADGIRQLRERTANLQEGYKLSPDQAKEYSDDINKLKAMIDNPKQRIWVDVEIENIDAAFRGYLHRFAGYIEEIGTISYYKTTLEFFVSLLKDADKAGFLSKRNLATLLEGLAPIVEWAQRGMVYQKQRVVINLKPVVEKIKAGDYSGAQEDISRAVGQLQERLQEIERIVASSKKQAASVFSAYRDKDINRRTEEISKSLAERDFESAFRDLETLLELYFNQDQVEPGYVRADLSLHKLVGLVRAAQRMKDPSGIIAQSQALLKLVRDDVEHKYSFKVRVVESNGKKTFAYVNPGTTIGGFLRSRDIDPDAVWVSVGAGWFKRKDFDRVKISDRKTLTIQRVEGQASSAIMPSAASILDAAPLAKEVKEKLYKVIQDFMSQLFQARGRGVAYQTKFFENEIQKGLVTSFRQVEDKEIKYFALALNAEWKRRGFDKDFGSLFNYVALIFMEFFSDAPIVRENYQWLYSFLETASASDKAYALGVMVADMNNHLRNIGLHPEDNSRHAGLVEGNVPLDQEMLLGANVSDEQLFQKYFLSILDLDRAQRTALLPGEDGKTPNALDLTGEDLLLWGVILVIDPTNYNWRMGYGDGGNQKLAAFLSRYFGKDIDLDKVGIEFLLRAFGNKALEEKLPDIEALLIKAMSTTDEQWEKRGLRSPFSFVFSRDYLQGVLFERSYWSTPAFRLLGDPVLQLGLSEKYWPKDLQDQLRPGFGTQVLKDYPGGLRPLYVKAFTSPELTAIFPRLAAMLEKEKSNNATGERVPSAPAASAGVTGEISRKGSSAIRTIDLPSGAQVLTRYRGDLQLEKITEAHALIYDAGGELVFNRTPIVYGYTHTSLGTVNRALRVDLVEKIIKLDRERKASNLPNRVITIVEGGAGEGTALAEIRKELDKKGIANIRLVGFGDVPFKAWLGLPQGTQMILDKLENIDEYFAPEEIDMIYSYWGFSYVYGAEYYKKLTSLLKVNGKIFWEMHSDEANILKATGLVQIKENSTQFGDTYYLQKPVASAGVVAAITPMDIARVEKKSALTPEEIKQYSDEFPQWNWEKAAQVPWRECIHDPEKQPQPTTLNQLHLWENQIDVRRKFLHVFKEILDGSLTDQNEFGKALIEMNTLLNLGTSGSNYYFSRTVGAAFESEDELKVKAGQSRSGNFKSRATIILQKIKNFIGSDDILLSSDDLLIDVAALYRSFMTQYLFEVGNNSLGMNMVNGLLRLHGLVGIPHHNFDTKYREEFFNQLGAPKFLKEFIELVGSENKKSKAVQSSSALTAVAPGGIDFNADKLNLETRTSRGDLPAGQAGIKFEMSPQQLRELQNVPGFAPVIINIQPLINVRMFLGLKEGAKTPLAMSKVQ